MTISTMQNFDLLERVGEVLKERGNLANRSIAWHCHLTTLTYAAARAVVEAGGRLYISECNAATTKQSALSGLKDLGVPFYTGAHAAVKVLAHKPEIISDTGFVLTETYLRSGGGAPGAGISAACETTADGIGRLRDLRAMAALNIPVININEGELKSAIDNFHRVGDGLIEALQIATGRESLPGNLIVVVGYGRVGSGCAQYLKGIGAQVKVIEADPLRALKAHYDGFAVTSRLEALAKAEVVVTATGRPGLWQENFFEEARDGMVVINVGHDREEVAPALWEKKAKKIEVVNEVLKRYTFDSNRSGEKCLYLATGGNPANIALLTGSFEPTYIHLATELLTWEYLFQEAENLPAGELTLPRRVEEEVSSLALQALGYNNESVF
ncbi:MAG: adenosylhomocysteinase [Cyanobacteria bacterium REEB67]|nr:adenosylhomocysteinase [Cyanobacteria bacterium REEB67]